MFRVSMLIALLLVCVLGDTSFAQQPATATIYTDAAGNVWQLVKVAPVPSVLAPVPFTTTYSQSTGCASVSSSSSCGSSATSTTSSSSCGLSSSSASVRRGLFGRRR